MSRMICCLLTTLLLMAICRPGLSETVLDLGTSKRETSKKTVMITVKENAINTVKSGIFGANTSFRGGGYGFYDDTTNTFNETLLQKLRDSGVTHVRIPGGIEGDYIHWYECIGSVETRLPQVDCFSRDYPTYTQKDGAEYVVTFGPDEWFELCNSSGTALTVQLNSGNGTPQEAADFVRYCLDSGVEIESIAVGNEACMEEERVDWIRVTKTPQEYINFYQQVWDLMSNETKQELKDRNIPFGAIGIPSSHPLNRYRAWDANVLKSIGDTADFIDIHIGYTPYFVNGNSREETIKCLLASSELVKKYLNEEIAVIERYAPNVKIAIAEHGPIGAAPYSSGMAGGVYLAGFFHAVLAEERVISADYLPLTNHPDANNLLGYFKRDEKETSFDNVVSIIFRMYAEQIGRSVLETSVEGAQTFDSVNVGLMPSISGVSEGDAAVYYDSETGTGTMFVLNKSYNQNTMFDVTLPYESVRVNQIVEMYASVDTMYNSYNRPLVVRPTYYDEFNGTLIDGHFVITTKPISVLKIDFSLTGE